MLRVLGNDQAQDDENKDNCAEAENKNIAHAMPRYGLLCTIIGNPF